MKLFTFRKIALTGVMATAGLALVGAGAHAVFTTSTTSSQSITAGTLSVALSSPGTSCLTAASACTSLTLSPVGPTASSFTTGNQIVTMTNTGNIPANITSEGISTTYPTSALASELSICEVQYGYVVYNGPLSGAGTVPFGPGNPIAPGSSVPLTINVFAGHETTACGTGTVGTLAVSGTSSASDLTNSAMGQSVAVTTTVAFSG